MLVENVLVDFANASGHVFMAKLLCEHLATAVAECGSQSGILCQLNHGAGKPLDIAVWNEAPGDAFDADFRSAVDVEGDNGFCCKQTLRDNSRQSFPVTGVHDHIHGVDEIRHLIGRNESGEPEPVCQSELLDSLLVDLSEGAVTNQQKLRVGNATGDSGGCFDQVVVSFEVKQSTNFAKDDVFF